MLEKPDLPDVHIGRCLRDMYGLTATHVEFLPLGADVNTAVYRVAASDGRDYFLKLRSGVFAELSVAVAYSLSTQGISAIIAPLPTKHGQLWATLAPFTAVLYPFVSGQNGFALPLTEQQLIELGATLKRIHHAELPAALRQRLPTEAFGPYWRERLRMFQAQADSGVFHEPVAAQLASLLRARHNVITDLIHQAARLAQHMQAERLEHVLCHADIHAANVLIDTSGRLYVVDWDTLVLAPRERDLMYIGAGLGIGDTAQRAALIYQGYGQAAINQAALAYYRFERIVEDFVAYCEQLLLSDEGGADREQALRFVAAMFEPGEVIERAYQ